MTISKGSSILKKRRLCSFGILETHDRAIKDNFLKGSQHFLVVPDEANKGEEIVLNSKEIMTFACLYLNSVLSFFF